MSLKSFESVFIINKAFYFVEKQFCRKIENVLS